MATKWISAAAVLMATAAYSIAGSMPADWQYQTTLVTGQGGANPTIYNWGLGEYRYNSPLAPKTEAQYLSPTGWQTPTPTGINGYSPATSYLQLGTVSLLETPNLQGSTFAAGGQSPFVLGLTLTNSSGATGTASFSGQVGAFVYGGINTGSPVYVSQVNVTFSNGLDYQDGYVVLGGNRYDIQVSYSPAPFTEPWVPTSMTLDGSSLSATNIASFNATVAEYPLTPEPGTFALVGIGLGFIGLRRFRPRLASVTS
jgi:hypothetical protein